MPITIYKTQAFNQIFLYFEAKHKKHKTQTQIFGLHAHHKPRNQHRNTTLPQTHKPKNQHTPQNHKPRSIKLTTHKPRSTKLTTPDLGSNIESMTVVLYNGAIPNRWTFAMGL